MKLKKIMLVTLMLLAIIAIGAVSASEDIADDNITSIEPTDDLTVSQVDDENVIQTVDDEINGAEDSEEILSEDEVFEPDVFFPYSGQHIYFSEGEIFQARMEAPGANGTFRVYYSGWNDFGPFKYNNTLLASADIIDGIGIVNLTVPIGGNPIYTVGYDFIDYWVEYETNKGNGDTFFSIWVVENNKNISAKLDRMEFTEGGNNNVTLQFASPVYGFLNCYVDGVSLPEYHFDDVNSAKVLFEYLSVGTHFIKVLFTYNETFDNVGTFSKTFIVTVNPWVPVIVQTATKITASKLTTTYNVAGKVTFTLKDEDGRVLSGENVTVIFNGKTYNKVTDSKGQVSVDIPSGLAPKTYNAYIKFEGDESFKASSASAKVVVSKATPKITAKAKTFKKSVKTKKYTITLKNNLNKVMKNTKVTIKVNKKTYTAKTNSKGVATFKITKLAKKGKYTATVKYAGNKYYNSKSVKVKITVK